MHLDFDRSNTILSITSIVGNERNLAGRRTQATKDYVASHLSYSHQSSQTLPTLYLQMCMCRTTLSKIMCTRSLEDSNDRVCLPVLSVTCLASTPLLQARVTAYKRCYSMQEPLLQIKTDEEHVHSY